ncbi:myo-inositol-1(or 4)-monophosphatase [Antricoccus suffuscus]|uniref:Inositol-1-monophosphatase n=1 Tax=Antricoccus suffuscus TaxID=1629062 RepID=A0A2T1A4X8_9ACTN|nr:inositol monophosphatase family protein [Antricoccus suffuscus]PRZ43655.1 myo-inositol-1(or 4)-monophosphatase [Antricoccus suffuscus]
MTARPDPAAMRDLAVDLGVRAGRLIREGRAEGIRDVQTKTSDVDVVTAMDKACESFLIEELRVARPGDGVYGEEHGERASETGVRWIIDPIDGTVNYLYGIPDYAVSIACEIDGAVVAGAVVRPHSRAVYHAYAGGGAYRDNVPLHGSTPASLAASLVATGFGYLAARREQQGALVAKVLGSVRDIRRIGSAALDICYAAEGRLDAYYEWGLHAWDFAAATLIAAEAGLTVRSPAHEAGLLVVGAPAVADDLARLLHAHIDPSWGVPD